MKADSPKNQNFQTTLKNATLGFVKVSPMILAILILLGLMKTWVTPEMWTRVFDGVWWHDLITGTFTGTVAMGQAVVGYLVAGEFWKEGISLFAVTAFILAWTSVGIVQLPMEAALFGKRFTLYRNLIAFITIPILAGLTVLLYQLSTTLGLGL
jgi:uncharacterized membrane protein YraQ (UPF0718 family)